MTNGRDFSRCSQRTMVPRATIVRSKGMSFPVLRRMFAALLPIVGVGMWLVLVPPPVSAATPPCAAAHLTLRVEGVGAPVFTAMSHSGAFAIVTNTGQSACELSPVAGLSMRGAGGVTTATGTVAGARFMHPGPVVFPFDLEPGEVAATRLRWVDGDVYGSGPAVRARATSLVLAAADGPVVATMPATAVWGDMTPVTFDRERFTTALDPLGAASRPQAGAYVGAGPAGTTPTYRGVALRKLSLRRAPHGALDFTLDALRPNPDLNSGSIAGRLVPSGARAMFVDANNDCRLTFAFYGAQLTIAQAGGCGFGYGVSASGRYHASN